MPDLLVSASLEFFHEKFLGFACGSGGDAVYPQSSRASADGRFQLQGLVWLTTEDPAAPILTIRSEHVQEFVSSNKFSVSRVVSQVFSLNLKKIVRIQHQPKYAGELHAGAIISRRMDFSEVHRKIPLAAYESPVTGRLISEL
jgi:hypothetical protein